MKKQSTKNKKRTYHKPILVTSECLTGANVRYNGELLNYDWIKTFRKHIRILKVCPEMEIGLGVPRPPIWSISSPFGHRLIQPDTGKDITPKMSSFSKKFLSKHSTVDGFLLKSRSPSCGLDKVKLYAGADRAPVIGYTVGQFTRKVLETYPELPVSDERILSKRVNREQFLTTLFVTASFRSMTEDNSRQSLESFHDQYAMLIESLNVNRGKKMAKLLKSVSSSTLPKTVYLEYKSHLSQLLSRKHRLPARLLVLNKIIDSHSKVFSTAQKRELKFLLADYENGTSLFADISKTVSSIFNSHNLLTESISTFLSPFPLELLEK